MNAVELIGKVGANYLMTTFHADDDGETAVFLLDCLPPDEAVAIAQAILSDQKFAPIVDIKLPRHYVEEYVLPEHILTDERATYHRNANCSKPVQLLCSTGDDETQSLNAITAIGTQQLFGRPLLWVETVAQGSDLLTEKTLTKWSRALKGLMDLNIRSLKLIAKYIIETCRFVFDEGEPLPDALGLALPVLHMPRCRGQFLSIRDEHQTHASRWKTSFDNAHKKKACYLNKQNPSQLLLGEEDLAKAFNKFKPGIPEVHHQVIEAYIAAPTGWNDAAAALAQCEWDEIEPLFKGLRRQKLDLGLATLKFYRDAKPDHLTEADKEYLEGLSKSKRKQPEPEDIDFFERRRNEIKEDRKLKSHWDRFIYGMAKKCEDFIEGLLLTMETLINRSPEGEKRSLRIICEYRSKRGLRSLNIEAGQYFARRYKGLKQLLRDCVEFDVGHLFQFPNLLKEWRDDRVKLNRSQAKKALALKFTIEMSVDGYADNNERLSTQLEWKFNPNTVNSEFANDIERLTKNPLVYCSTNREPVSSKGHFQPLNLANIQSFAPVFGKQRGSFVGVYQPKGDLRRQWLENLKRASAEGFISKEAFQYLDRAFAKFANSYTSAIKAFVEIGLAADLLTQYSDFGDLLKLVCEHAKGDANRKLILKPLLEIGSVKIGGGQATRVVAPWHPLRLAAIAVKAQFATGLIKQLLTHKEIAFGDTGSLFFRDLQEVLAHPFYPEIVLGWENEATLLTLTDTVGDYSLHEMPFADKSPWSSDIHDNPKAGAVQVADMVNRYLQLHPHEQANLSVILYNCDTASLPQVVVEKIRALHQEEDELLCQVILRHRNAAKLREIYEKIVEGADETADSFSSSETTQDFMARLRIGIMADEAPPPQDDENRPEDIVFLQDVISRHAKEEWCEEKTDPVPLDQLFPSRWSRRRPSSKKDLKSEIFLCCPAQTEVGWTFLSAVTTFLKGDWNGITDQRLLPVRRLNFENKTVKHIFDETHSLGNWVVNYDDLLDRRQLTNQGVQVIRYKQTTTQGRNLIISSKAPMALLESMVDRRLRSLGLGFSQQERSNLAIRFIREANEVSGDLVLRAAKRGQSADELMGVVLSRFLIMKELGDDRSLGVFFLDDYAEWLGKKEQQIADLLFLAPRNDGEHYCLDIVISEAKYINADNLSNKRKEAQNQIRDTINRIGDALFLTPKRLDRPLWLSRLSDLLLDGIDVKSKDLNLIDCRRALRDGTCLVSLRGYAHLFIKSQDNVRDSSEFAKVSKCQHKAYMEVFSNRSLRNIIHCFAKNEDPFSIRKRADEEGDWPYQKITGQGENTSIFNHQRSNMFPSFPRKPTESIKSSKEKDMPAEDVVSLASKKTRSAPVPDDSRDKLTLWSFPGIDTCIQKYTVPSEDIEGEQKWLNETAKQFRRALQEFQLKSKMVGRVLTPNAAILKFEGSSNLTVDQVQKRQQQFLTTYGLQIIDVLPGPGLVSVIFQRPKRRVLKTLNIWKSWNPGVGNGNHKLLIAIREENGEPLFFSPKQNAPHTLIAGETGSGKSVLMQNIILAIGCTNTPQQAKIVLVDPKGGVDYFALESMPHLTQGIIDDCEEATRVLEGLIIEMEHRYQQLKENRVSNIFALNAKVEDDKKLPILWVIHDEFAEWMMIDEYKQAVSKTVSRLGTKARAAGIFLIFAAQRPDKDAMPMQLRANLGNRLILKVADEGTSEISLGIKNGKADKLLGRGHLAARLQNEQKEVVLAQVPLLENHELEHIVQLMAVQA